MNAGLVACTAVAAFVAGTIGTDLRSTPRSVRTDAAMVSVAGAYGTVSAQEKGRFKQEGTLSSVFMIENRHTAKGDRCLC